MVYLVKGSRRKGSVKQEQALTEAAGQPVALYKQASPLIYGYQDKSFPPKLAWGTDWRCTSAHPMRRSQWYPNGECPGDGRLHKRGDDWQSFPVWTSLGIREWIGMLDDGKITPEAGDALGEQWAMPVPNFRTQDQIGAWLRQTRAAESRIAASLEFLRNYESAVRESPEAGDLWEAWEVRLDESALGEQATSMCDRWFGRRCPAWDLCHGPDHVRRDPVGSGLYQIKTQFVERSEE